MLSARGFSELDLIARSLLDHAWKWINYPFAESVVRIVSQASMTSCLYSRTAKTNPHDWDQLELPGFIDLFTL